MTLIDEVKKIQEESFENRFNKWFEENRVEKQIKKAAGEGYTGFEFQVANFKQPAKTEILFRDKRFVESLTERLGHGFTVEYIYKKVPVKHVLLDLTTYRTENYLHVSW